MLDWDLFQEREVEMGGAIKRTPALDGTGENTHPYMR